MVAENRIIEDLCPVKDSAHELDAAGQKTILAEISARCFTRILIIVKSLVVRLYQCIRELTVLTGNALELVAITALLNHERSR